MQLYAVSWEFESSEDQVFCADALVDYVENGSSQEPKEGYERIAWLHFPQDGTGLVLCKAANASVLYKVFGPWRKQFGMKWSYKPALSTEELIGLLKEEN